jgi:hypothetical protein
MGKRIEWQIKRISLSVVFYERIGLSLSRDAALAVGLSLHLIDNAAALYQFGML